MEKKPVYKKDCLSAELTGELFKLIHRNSATTWENIEKKLKIIGAGSYMPKEGTARVGLAAEQFGIGKKRLPKDTAIKILGKAKQEKWISDDEFVFFHNWLTIFPESNGKIMESEKKIIEKLEKQGGRLIETLFSHPDLGEEDMLTAVDTLLLPLLKRVIREKYAGKPKRNFKKESFDSVLK